MKLIINAQDFLQGLSPNSDLVGGYAYGKDIDPQRDLGYLSPGYKEGTEVSSDGGVLSGLILDAAVDPDSTNIYAIGDSKLYKITVGTSFVNDVNFPHNTGGTGVVFYNAKVSSVSDTRLFYIQSDDIGLATVSTPTFNDTWLSTTASGGSNLNSSYKHPYLIWKSYLWVGNGNNLVKIDGQGGTDGTANMSALTLEDDWEITSLFPTKNYIGVCAWRKMNAGETYHSDARVFFWDGVSDDYNYFIPIADNKIFSSKNTGKEIFLLTRGRGNGTVLRRLTYSGDEIVRRIVMKPSSTYYYDLKHHNAVDVSQGRLLIGATTTYGHNAIFAYGSIDGSSPDALLQPFSSSHTFTAGGNGIVGMVKELFTGFIYASFYDNSKYYWVEFSGDYSTNAEWKGVYKTLGQRVKINYVKVFFKQLESGDDITVNLEYDYGKSVQLGTVKYSADGAVSSKIFRKAIDCFSFRPHIVWNGGKVKISQIVIDYSFIGD